MNRESQFAPGMIESVEILQVSPAVLRKRIELELKLKEIIDGEEKRNPLSDDALVKKLARHSFKLARRDVTECRKAMGIPSSRQRREF